MAEQPNPLNVTYRIATAAGQIDVLSNLFMNQMETVEEQITFLDMLGALFTNKAHLHLMSGIKLAAAGAKEHTHEVEQTTEWNEQGVKSTRVGTETSRAHIAQEVLIGETQEQTREGIESLLKDLGIDLDLGDPEGPQEPEMDEEDLQRAYQEQELREDELDEEEPNA